MSPYLRLSALRFGATVLLLLLLPTVIIALPALMLSPSGSLPDPYEEAAGEEGQLDLILDPGHGGADGGALSVLGEPEKDLNLEMSAGLAELLALCGLRTEMTRTTDEMLGTELPDSLGSGKMRDLAARLAVMERHPEALFVSIHMNRFSDPACSGTQIWYAGANEASASLARALSDAVKQTLQPDNHRVSKEGDSSIYLLHRARSCAVLVECGFLSNPEEAALLSDPAYQSALASSLTLGILRHLDEGAPGTDRG